MAGVGAYDRAGEAYAASAACRATGEVFREAILLTNLSFVAYNEGKYEEARAHAEGHLRKLGSVNMKKRCDCLILSALAGALAQLGAPEKATRLLAASELYMEEMGAEYQHVDAQDVQKHREAIRAALDPAAFDAAWAEGRTMSLEEAVAYALDEHRRFQPPATQSKHAKAS